MVSNHVEYSLLEPLLMGSDNEAQADVQFKPANRRDHAAAPTLSNRGDACGRARLFILAIFAFLILYITIASTQVDLPQIIVRVPPDENEVPKTPDPVLSTTSNTPTTSSIHVAQCDNVTEKSSVINFNNASLTVPKGYLVWSPQCKIASLDPMAADVMKLYHREKAIACTTKPPLTSVQWNPVTQKYNLKVVEEARGSYRIKSGDKCVCQEVTRKSENKISLSDGIRFSSEVELSGDTEFIYVECFQAGHKMASYKDVHFIVQRMPSITKRLSAIPKRVKPNSTSTTEASVNSSQIPSVLMIGIDSISRLNLLRAMPKTAQHLYDKGWFEMKGYNKMGDNTYPNLMAILTGYNDTWAYDKCLPHTDTGLDNCPFIWKEFAAAGYVTGYAEDEPEIGTFNYKKKGFSSNPTDFYGRAGMIAANRLTKVMRSNLAICLGDRSAADYVYQYGLDISEKFREEGAFGLYWTNSFSHNDLNTPSSMDDRIKYYLMELERRSILNDSIVIFFSDHGLRFGPVRKLVTGWMEERLPFLFYWLPTWFRERHPEIVQALKVNRNRLTNPYDLHLTLKHILRLSERGPLAVENEQTDVAMGCENCQSMFREVPWNRSCEEIGIAAHWCTCSPFLPIDKNSRMVKKATHFLLKYMNNEITRLLNGTTKANGGRLCSELELKLVYFAGETEYKADYTDILIQFETKPGGGDFESTVRYVKAKDSFSVTGTISRLNSYAKNTCVDNARMYCECL